MASEVSIINRALLLLGARPITARTDESEEARVAHRTYDDIRDQLLRSHPWNFAQKRASLAASATAPEWEFDNAYVLPSDCLRLIKVDGFEDDAWRIEQDENGLLTLVTDLDSPLDIVYTARVTNVDLFDHGFQKALADQCAAMWAERLTGSTDRAMKAQQLADRSLSMARNTDGQEQSQDVYEALDWIDSRV